MKKRKTIEVPAIQWETMKLRIRGITPLIVRNFDDKTKAAMAANQAGDAQNKREPKDPNDFYQRARLLNAKGQDCIRALWVKCACVDAARFVDGVKMTELRGALHVDGDMLVLQYKSVRMRCDSVRLPMGKADLAYRPEYTDWSVEVTVRYRPNMLTASSVLNLLNNAGQCIGLCERRPGQNGDQFGMFEVEIPGGGKRRRAA